MIGQNKRHQGPKDPRMGGKVTLDPNVVGKDRLHGSRGPADPSVIGSKEEGLKTMKPLMDRPHSSRGPADPSVIGRKNPEFEGTTEGRKTIQPLMDRPVGGIGVTKASASGIPIPPELKDKRDTIQPVMMTATNYEPEPEFNQTTTTGTQEHPGYWVRGTHYNKDGSKSGKTRMTPQEIVDAGGEPAYKQVVNPNQTYQAPDQTNNQTTDQANKQSDMEAVTASDQYQSVREQLQNNLTNPQLPDSAKQTYTDIELKAGELVDPNNYKMGDTPEATAGQQAAIAEAEAGKAAVTNYNSAQATVDGLKEAMEAQLATQGSVDPALTAQYNAAKAEFTTIQTATKGYVSKLAQGAIATASNAEAAYQDLDKVNPKTLAKALTHDVPNEATVQGQLDGLLEGLESGDVPMWAKPAIAQAEAQLASRGMSTSSVGRNALFNSIISSAMPIAQQDAKTKLAVFQQDISNEQQAILSNSQFFQTLTVKNLDNKQQAAITNATNATNASIASAQNMTQASIANANNFLQMDIANMNMEQQTNIINGQMRQQAMLSNQSAENTALQFNAANEQQASQFNTNLAASIEQFNVTQANNMSQFSASEVNKNQQLSAQLEQQLALANQSAQNQALQFGADASNKASLQDAQLTSQANQANAAAWNSMNQFNAQQQSAMSQFNAQLGFNKEQFNVQNATAIEQSNANWRRQMNQLNTAGVNAVNQANAMNQFNLSNQALTFLWQEQRDAAKWANDNAQNDEERKTRMAIAALGNESMQDASTLANIKSLAGAVISIFDNWD